MVARLEEGCPGSYEIVWSDGEGAHFGGESGGEVERRCYGVLEEGGVDCAERVGEVRGGNGMKSRIYAGMNWL
jgi:uncharacterized membrane protein